jgi:hypothetical protein
MLLIYHKIQKIIFYIELIIKYLILLVFMTVLKIVLLDLFYLPKYKNVFFIYKVRIILYSQLHFLIVKIFYKI